MAIAHPSRDTDPDSPFHMLHEPGAPVMGSAETPSLAPGWYRSFGSWVYVEIGKRLMDFVVASVALVALAPILLIVALAVRVDSPGPALFRQERIGKGHRPFTMLKFRTMRHTGRQRIEWMVDEHGAIRHKVRHDPRVTRVGYWLRRTSVDELPQLINVLLGHMSLIGPRPEVPEIVDHYAPWQHQRHVVRPGLTGWWQVSGRSDLPMHEHTELDLYYVNNVSPLLDLKIVVRTVGVVLRGFGAY